MRKNTLIKCSIYFCEKIKHRIGGPLFTFMKYSFREDEWKMSGSKTTYSIAEKQL